MSILEDINTGYDAVIGELAWRARAIKKESGGADIDAVMRAIDDGFMYGEDKAIVLAHALINDFVKWGREVDAETWQAIEEDMRADILEEMKK